MKNVKVYLFILLLLFISGCMSSGTKPLEPIIWQKVFGGDYYDFAFSVDVSNDGGYIVAGKTLSYGAGGSDAYILKLDANGNKLWEKFYGGSADDIIYSILQLDDGSYIGVGETYSMGEGNADFYVLKLKQDGDADWVKSFGGINADIANSIAKLNDGYILAGYTTSFGAGGSDFYILRLNSQGDVTWSKTYGGTQPECANSVKPTSDGGFIIVGHVNKGSNDYDLYILKLKEDGEEEWHLVYGDTGDDRAFDVVEVEAGKYVVCGYSDSKESGDYDIYLLEVLENGNIAWERKIGGNNNDKAYSIVKTGDGGFILAGETSQESFKDVYVVKVDSNGIKEWDKKYGGPSNDEARCIKTTPDGGYIVAGATASFGPSAYNFYVLKLDKDGNTGANPQ